MTGSMHYEEHGAAAVDTHCPPWCRSHVRDHDSAELLHLNERRGPALGEEHWVVSINDGAEAAWVVDLGGTELDAPQARRMGWALLEAASDLDGTGRNAVAWQVFRHLAEREVTPELLSALAEALGVEWTDLLN